MSIVEYTGPSNPQEIRKYLMRRTKDEIVHEYLRQWREYGELEKERDALRYYATALRLHWHTSRDPFWDGNLEDLDRAVPPPDCWRRHDQDQETR